MFWGHCYQSDERLNCDMNYVTSELVLDFHLETTSLPIPKKVV